MRLTEGMLEYYQNEALRAIKILDRSMIASSRHSFHAALHKLRQIIPHSSRWSEINEIMETLCDYPEVLCKCLDARDQLNEIVLLGRNLRAWQEVEKNFKDKEPRSE